MRRKLVALIVVALLALAGLTTANAAGLNLQSSVSVTAGQACSTGPISVTRTEPVYFLWIFLLGYEGVRLSGIPESCRNLPIRITAGNGEAEGTSAGASGATLDIHMNARYGTGVTAFHLVIDGWHVPVG